MNLSLRGRLTLWFGLVMAVSLGIFGILTYTSIDNQLNEGLDVALNNAVQGLDVFIKKQAEQAEEAKEAPPRRRNRRPAATDTATDELDFLRQIDSTKKDSSIIPSIQPLAAEAQRPNQKPQAAEADKIWSSITEYFVLNTRNFMVQVMDSTGSIVYRSASLGTDSLDVPFAWVEAADTSEASFHSMPRTIERADQSKTTQMVRAAVAKSRSAIVVVAYPLDDVQSSLQSFLDTLMLMIPLVLLISTIGGWFLARKSLAQVDELTRTAQDITASNLSRRLPVGKSNDEISRLSETLNDMISRLEMSFGRIRQFTADASHELRTPLTILTGELELALRSGKSPEQYQDVISSALQETLRMSRVVEDLLLLSRADTGRVRLKLEPTDLNEILVDLADATAVLGSRKDIYISYRHSKEKMMVMADPARIYQMFLNLLDNAVKYTPHGGSISITLHRDGNYAETRVRDTGIGISAEHQKKIFHRFYRVDKARSREQGGVGLGLSIVEWTVDAHDGRISVESEPGQGSTFIVRLPLMPTEELQDVPANGTEAAGERQGLVGAFEHLPRFLKRKDEEEPKSTDGKG